MIEQIATNASELKLLLRLASSGNKWDFLGIIGRQPWRHDFYEQYEYFMDNNVISPNLLHFQERWPQLENDVVEFLLANPHHSVITHVPPEE